MKSISNSYQGSRAALDLAEITLNPCSNPNQVSELGDFNRVTDSFNNNQVSEFFNGQLNGSISKQVFNKNSNIMRTSKLFASLLSIGIIFASCKKDETTPPPSTDPGESSTELLVNKFTSAPTLDGNIDNMWNTSKRLVGVAEVPVLGDRMTFLNSDGAGVEEDLGLFEPFSGDKYNYKLRSGYFGDNIYFLMEWDDPDDSQDRQSWYFDGADKKWKQEHKYANDVNDKYYEDKFAFLFPVGTVDNFSTSTCYATCHAVSAIATDKDKHTRHYLKGSGQVVDMWHWKRVRGSFMGQVDDQQMVYVAPPYDSGSNGRKGDATGQGGYSNNSQTLTITGTMTDVNVPKYVIPGRTGYYWISETEINDGTAMLITEVDADGVLTYSGGTIDPASGGFEQSSGNMRMPSVTTRPFTMGRGDISIVATHTGSGWICEFTRKMNTGDSDDVVFDVTQELAFGLALFDNAAIAHAIKPNLIMKFQQ